MTYDPPTMGVIASTAESVLFRDLWQENNVLKWRKDVDPPATFHIPSWNQGVISHFARLVGTTYWHGQTGLIPLDEYDRFADPERTVPPAADESRRRTTIKVGVGLAALSAVALAGYAVGGARAGRAAAGVAVPLVEKVYKGASVIVSIGDIGKASYIVLCIAKQAVMALLATLRSAADHPPPTPPAVELEEELFPPIPPRLPPGLHYQLPSATPAPPTVTVASSSDWVTISTMASFPPAVPSASKWLPPNISSSDPLLHPLLHLDARPRYAVRENMGVDTRRILARFAPTPSCFRRDQFNATVHPIRSALVASIDRGKVQTLQMTTAGWRLETRSDPGMCLAGGWEGHGAARPTPKLGLGQGISAALSSLFRGFPTR